MLEKNSLQNEPFLSLTPSVVFTLLFDLKFQSNIGGTVLDWNRLLLPTFILVLYGWNDLKMKSLIKYVWWTVNFLVSEEIKFPQFSVMFSSPTFFRFRFTISIRDLLSWVMFINATVENNNNAINNDVAMEEELNADDEDSSGGEKRITAEEAYVHGACLVFIDAIGSGNTAFGGNRLAEVVKKECITFLSAQVGSQGFAITKSLYTNTVAKFGIHPFLIEKGKSVFFTQTDTWRKQRTFFCLWDGILLNWVFEFRLSYGKVLNC